MPRQTTRSNLRSTLKRRPRTASPMAAYDRLPVELRLWLAQAALPWSTQSALRLWRKTLRTCGGNTEEALHRLCRIEQGTLSRDARRIWGESHPAAQGTAPDGA